jgi:DNA repair protein RadC
MDMPGVAEHDRPREKLSRHGAGALGDNELLAVLIGHGRPGADALAVSNQILTLAGGLQGLTRLHHDRLRGVPGVGPAQASRITAAIELGRRTLTMAGQRRPQFKTPEEAARYLLPQFGAHPVERFGVLLLDARYRLIATRILSIGSLDRSLGHPRDVFREALVAGAGAVVVFHNHPSGDPTPSQDDRSVTARLRLAGAAIGVPLLDHVVLADDRYCSFRKLGWI